MSTPELQSVPSGGDREMIPLSALNQFLFCARRAALIHVEGIFKDNHHTLRGDIVHEHSDLRGFEIVQGVKLLRALPVFSARLALNGKCDIVEASPANLRSDLSNLSSLKPVEFKLGKRRQWENDDVQLCAQALCLEEMFNIPVPAGAIFHADSKRRREVEFTAALRQATETAAADLHRLVAEGRVPPAVRRPACEECSLFDLCLPSISAAPERTQRAARALFEI